MRNRPLGDILASRRWEVGREGEACMGSFVCRQMASCPLKKRFGRKDTKGGHTTSSAFLFTGSGSFIPARLCESTAERSLL